MSLRRIVEGWMGDLLYKSLGDEPNIETTWSLLRDLVGQHLFNSEYVTVPFIQSTAYFNQLFLFIKKQSFLSVLGIRPPTYKVIGNMDYILNRDVSTWNTQFDFSPWDVNDGRRMYSEYNLRITSNQAGVPKTIEFKAVDAHARGAQPPEPGSVAIHRNLLEDLRGVKTLYVITDVVLASYVKLLVRIGEQTKTFICERDMPIGFIYRKYRLRNDGTFASELTTSLRLHDRDAIWLQPSPQPIPPVPMWDYMRRRYNGDDRRKIRNNLTIPTQRGHPDHIQVPRRPIEEADGFLRIERPLDNDAVVQARDVIQVNDNFLRRNLSNEEHRQNQPVAARGSVSMEALRGSDVEEE